MLAIIGEIEVKCAKVDKYCGKLYLMIFFVLCIYIMYLPLNAKHLLGVNYE